MNSDEVSVWWLIPSVLGGMPMPFIHPERRLAGGGLLHSFPDELPALDKAGVRAVVSLLNIPADRAVFESAGFQFLCLPVPDGRPPTVDQVKEFIRFVHNQRNAHQPTVVHCEAGIGRTGTLLATYLIAEGHSAQAAIQRVRLIESAAIETTSQIAFLHQLAADPSLLG
ncbi:MAG TPA: protein-tyrosine phosphatase family protein [Verrucomicrobiae bacterium]|nr:protein-tyrosine phosphatase family protein [Verrucomicrobiae bacterium]